MRRIAPVVLLIVGLAVVAALASALAWLTGGLTVPAGPVRFGLHDAFKPAAVSLACAGAAVLAWPWERRWPYAGLLLVAGAADLTLAIAARRLPAPSAVGDAAVTELFVLYAAQGDWLLGPYSQFHWHHPGPLMFYAMVPLYAAAHQHPAALTLTAGLIGVAALLGTAAVSARLLPAPVVVSLGAFVALWVARTASIVASYWNAHLIVLPFLLYLWLTAATAAGSARWLPLLVAVGSLLAQSHVGMLPVVGCLGLLALVGSRRAATVADQAGAREGWWRAVNTGAWVGVALWALPFAEQLTSRPGNLNQIAAFFAAQPGFDRPFAGSLHAWTVALAGPLLPGFHIPVGWAVSTERDVLALALAFAQVTGLIALLWRRRRHPPIVAACVTTLLATAVALLAIARIPGEIHDHAVFWVGTIGISGWGLLAGGLALEWLDGARIESRPWRMASRAATVAVPVIATVIVAVPMVRGLRAAPPTLARPAVATLTDATVHALDAHGASRPLLRMADDVWIDGAGLVLQLYKRGHAFAVERRWQHMFGAPVAARRCDFTHALHIVRAGSSQVGEPVGRAGGVEVRLETSPVCGDGDLAP